MTENGNLERALQRLAEGHVEMQEQAKALQQQMTALATSQAILIQNQTAHAQEKDSFRKEMHDIRMQLVMIVDILNRLPEATAQRIGFSQKEQ